MNEDFFYICGIPFKFLSFRGNAANCRIGNSRQLVFIPKKYFESDGSLKENQDLIWFINKSSTMHKIKLAADEELHGVSQRINENRRRRRY